jgi:hypothetical protein
MTGCQCGHPIVVASCQNSDLVAMSALGQERPFRPGQANVRFAPIADIREWLMWQCDGRCFGFTNTAVNMASRQCRPYKFFAMTWPIASLASETY